MGIDETGLFITPEHTSPKFYIKHLYPYYLVKRNAGNRVILDIGSGDGYGSSYLAEEADRVIGIDCEEKSVEYARNKYTGDNLNFELMDATSLTFRDETFDIVCSFQMIEHVKEDMLLKYLSEISRVLKPSGVFYVSTLNRDLAMKPGQPYDKNPYHEEEFNAAELRELLLKVFPEVEMSGLHPSAKHRFFQRVKKTGLFKLFPEHLNPVERFYESITLQDFRISKKNLEKALDLICICHKELGASSRSRKMRKLSG